PARARAMAVASPMPWPPPRTSAPFPCSPNAVSLIIHSCFTPSALALLLISQLRQHLDGHRPHPVDTSLAYRFADLITYQPALWRPHQATTRSPPNHGCRP